MLSPDLMPAAFFGALVMKKLRSTNYKFILLLLLLRATPAVFPGQTNLFAVMARTTSQILGSYLYTGYWWNNRGEWQLVPS